MFTNIFKPTFLCGDFTISEPYSIVKINTSPAKTILSSCLLRPGCTAVSYKPSSMLGSEVSSIFVSTMELCHPSVNLAVRRVCKTQMLLPGLLCWASVTWPINGKMFTLCHFSQSCRWGMSQKQIKRQINWCSMLHHDHDQSSLLRQGQDWRNISKKYSSFKFLNSFEVWLHNIYVMLC